MDNKPNSDDKAKPGMSIFQVPGMSIFQAPEQICPVHGQTPVITLALRDVTRSLCYRCIMDFTDECPVIYGATEVRRERE